MAKTTIKQIVKGDKHGAKTLANNAKTLRKLAGFEQEKIGNLRTQYDTAVSTIDENFQKNLQLLLGNLAEVGSNYEQAGKDNDAAESDSSFANLANERRERQQTLDQVFRQGGGETDQLRAQSAALRNWGGNQQEVMRSYSDTVGDINRSISDANTSARTEIHNAAANMDREKRLAFNDRQTGIGQALGSMIDMYGDSENKHAQARDAAGVERSKSVTKGTKNQSMTQTQSWGHGGKSKTYEKRRKQDEKNLLKAGEALRDLNAESYTGTVGTPEDYGFTSLQRLDKTQNMSDLDNAQTLTAIKKPQGATLRKLGE